MAIVVSEFGLSFKDSKEERFFRQTHPYHPYTQKVEQRFVRQTQGKNLNVQQQSTLNDILGKWGSALFGGATPVNNNPSTPSNTGGGYYNPMPGQSTYVPTTPPLDQTPPVIVPTTPNSPTVPIGSGEGNPTNRLELNSLVAVGIGFVFIRGAFKLLGKIF